MHGRQRTILRTLLSDRTREMQTHLALNKLRLVIRMVLPKPRSSLNFADLKDKHGTRMTDQIKIDLAASSTLKEWMGVPPTLHPLSRSFEEHPDLAKWHLRTQRSHHPSRFMGSHIACFPAQDPRSQTSSTAPHGHEFTLLPQRILQGPNTLGERQASGPLWGHIEPN